MHSKYNTIWSANSNKNGDFEWKWWFHLKIFWFWSVLRNKAHWNQMQWWSSEDLSWDRICLVISSIQHVLLHLFIRILIIKLKDLYRNGFFFSTDSFRFIPFNLVISYQNILIVAIRRCSFEDILCNIFVYTFQPPSKDPFNQIRCCCFLQYKNLIVSCSLFLFFFLLHLDISHRNHSDQIE